MSLTRDLAQRVKARVPMHRRRQLAFMRLRLRQPTADFRALPDFLVIGAQRCGTSSLYKYLGAHPHIIPSLRKEIEYFSTSFHEGERWYRAHFPLEARRRLAMGARGLRPLTFEATPDYLLDPRAAARAAALVPDAKIVVLLRNPVSRAFSQYHHNRRLGHEPRSFEEALDAEDERLAGEFERLEADPMYQAVALRRFSYVTRGRFADQLRPWLRRFPSDQVRIVASDDLFGDTASELEELQAFLGVPVSEQNNYRNYSYASEPPRNRPQMSAETQERLAEVFETANRDLFQLVGRDFGWNRKADPEVRS